MGRKPIVAVDFDGTLHQYSKGFDDGTCYDPPFPAARNVMKVWADAGWTILIYSVRTYNSPTGKSEIEAWMHIHDIPYTEVYNGHGKPFADVYLDDRAVGFRGDWSQSMLDVGRRIGELGIDDTGCEHLEEQRRAWQDSTTC